MSIAQMLLPEFDQEMGNTRKMLEAIPNDRLNYKPHEKGWNMAGLVTHLVMIPDWGAQTIKTESMDFTGFTPPPAVKSKEEAIATFDKNAVACREALSGVSDEALQHQWTLSGNGQVFFTLPRIAVLRSFVFNHAIHHRAQLGMLLRECGAKVPGMYGPSADEM
jgi:uncharacterized damage-inducible protein DinB